LPRPAAQFLALDPLFLAHPIEPALGARGGQLLRLGQQLGEPLARVGAVGFLGAETPRRDHQFAAGGHAAARQLAHTGEHRRREAQRIDVEP
jgi:hypothetical protein